MTFEDALRETMANHGFFTSQGLAAIVAAMENDRARYLKLQRLAQVLIRCHEGRMTTPLQDSLRFLGAIQAGGLAVRDVAPTAESHNAIMAAIRLEIADIDRKRRAERGNPVLITGTWDGSQVGTDADPGL